MYNEKLAGLKDKLVTYAKNLKGRKTELLDAHTGKVISEGMLNRLAPKETIAAGELVKMRLRPDIYSHTEVASAEGGLKSIKDSVKHYSAERDRFKGEVRDIKSSVLKARIGAGVAGATVLSGAAYAAKKYYDGSVQTQLSDRDKVAYFNPAPWADDVINSYTQVKLVWEQKRRAAEEREKANRGD